MTARLYYTSVKVQFRSNSYLIKRQEHPRYPRYRTVWVWSELLLVQDWLRALLLPCAQLPEYKAPAVITGDLECRAAAMCSAVDVEGCTHTGMGVSFGPLKQTVVVIQQTVVPPRKRVVSSSKTCSALHVSNIKISVIARSKNSKLENSTAPTSQLCITA